MKKSRRTTQRQLWMPFFNVFLVLGALAVCGTYALLYDRPTVSMAEKRVLAAFPDFSAEALFTGDYTRALSAFFSDTFPGRESLVRLAGALKEGGGLTYDGIRIHEGGGGEARETPMLEAPGLGGQVSSPPPPADPPGASAAPPDDDIGSVAPPPDDGAQGVRMGAIFIYNGKGYQIFGGTEAAGAQYAEAVNAYREAVGDKVRIYNMVIPSAIEFALPSRYQSITVPELPRVEGIIDRLDPGVEPVNVYSALAEHRDEYIYFNTDHHWTSLGAYYAYVEFCEVAGLEPVDLSSLEKRTLEGFLGTLYSQTQDSKMREKVDCVDYYMMPTGHRCYQYRKNAPFSPVEVSLYGEYAQPVNSYSVFLHGDFPLTRIETEVKNGRRIAVVKESYGNAFAPFLINNYERILVVDQRYLQVGLLSLLEQYDINELLFINNIFAAHTGSHINELRRIMRQVYVPPPPPPPAVSEPEEREPPAGEEGVADAGTNHPGEPDGNGPPPAAAEAPS